MRVLIVDDEVEFLQLMEKRLSRRGMTVSTAPDGQSALALLDTARDSNEEMYGWWSWTCGCPAWTAWKPCVG